MGITLNSAVATLVDATVLDPPEPIEHKTEWLRVGNTSRPVEVDREANVIRGMVLAQEGIFKSESRGEFNRKGIQQVVKMAKAAPAGGLKSRFAHPSESDDGIGKLLGRIRSPFLAKMEKDGAEITVARGDLHMDPTAMEEPVGGGRPLGDYIMALAESDPEALSSSLVLNADKIEQLDKQGRPILNDAGDPLGPLWYPTQLHACDIVDTGEAVDGLLSAETLDGLPNSAIFRGVQLLDKQFAGKSREFVRERLTHFMDRYLTRRYGGALLPGIPQNVLDVLKREHREAAERGDGGLVTLRFDMLSGEWEVGADTTAKLDPIPGLDYNPATDPELLRRQRKNRVDRENPPG